MFTLELQPAIAALRRRPRCDLCGPRPLGEDTDHVEAHGLEVWLCGVQRQCSATERRVFCLGGDGFQWVSEAGPAPQLDFHKDERLGSNIQTLATPELVFRVLLTEDGTQCLELASGVPAPSG